MSNKLCSDKKSAAVSMLCEGNSIRAIERMTGIHRDTVMRLGVRMGEGCAKIMDERFRALDCRVIQLDETWGFVGMKQKTANMLGASEGVGSIWTWVAIDAESKLVPAFHIGGRTQADADIFVEDLASRLSHRVQISSDALRAYQGAIERAFGTEVDYGSVVKIYSSSQIEEQRRYSPPDVVNIYINNAFFCCDGVMLYGDGDGRTYTYLAGGLDVVAHEMSHGVTEFSSNLVYQDESGALNEAFSDIMGAATEFFYQPVGTGQEKADWLIGEDVVIRFPGYLRSLSNPNAVFDPDHYSLLRFIGTDVDNGGVHYNMTIVTHAFYLAVAGGRNRVSNQTVTGVGMANIERMEKIFYRAWVLLMGPTSKFTDARAATLQAASDLYGASSNERTQVAAAWSAVGVN